MTKLPRILFSLTILIIFFILPSHIDAQQVPCYGDGLADGIIDHKDVCLFDQIPNSYIDSAREMNFLFIDRSVGSNINDGLNCLGYGTLFSSASNSCKTGLTEQTYISDAKYNNSNWQFVHYGNGGWYDNVKNYITHSNLIIPTPEGSSISFEAPYTSFDVINYQFSYLDVAQTSDITSSTGFFRPFPGDVNRIRDIHDFVTFESSLPSQIFFYATSSLARTIGGSVSHTFNNQMRDYTRQNNIRLLDIADIGSHTPEGTLCVDADGFPNLCSNYTSESVGGHLSYGFSKTYFAKAVWVMMASIAGWQPNNPPLATPTITIPPTHTPTTSPSPTSSPSINPLPKPGDANGDGIVDGVDYVIWLNHYNQNMTGVSNGDFNNDGVVDGIDYVVWLNNYS